MTKTRQESPAKGHICGFLQFSLPNLGHLERYIHGPKQYVFLKFIVENKAFSFLKRALIDCMSQ